jgi:hypothetical protein
MVSSFSSIRLAACSPIGAIREVFSLTDGVDRFSIGIGNMLHYF